MKTPRTLHFSAALCAALLFSGVSGRDLRAQNAGTSTEEETAIAAAESAGDAAQSADNAAHEAEMNATSNGNRPVDVDRAKIMQQRANDALQAFLAALAKAEKALANVPSGTFYFDDLNLRLQRLKELAEIIQTPWPDQARANTVSPTGIFGDFNGDGKPDLLGRVTAITGTGETIGHVADMKLMNASTQPVTLTIPPTVLYSTSRQRQNYAIPEPTTVTLAPNSTQTVALNGVCLDARKPAVGNGVSNELAILNPASPDMPQRFKDELAGVQRVTATVSQLQNDGKISTPFSSNPAKERDTIVQWTTWLAVSTVEGHPLTKRDLKRKVYEQTGIATPGLEQVIFNTSSGTVRVNLPDDLRTGDTISGTVLVEPAGTTAGERSKNMDALKGSIVRISGSFSGALPNGLVIVPETGKSPVATPTTNFPTAPADQIPKPQQPGPAIGMAFIDIVIGNDLSPIATATTNFPTAPADQLPGFKNHLHLLSIHVPTSSLPQRSVDTASHEGNQVSFTLPKPSTDSVKLTFVQKQGSPAGVPAVHVSGPSFTLPEPPIPNTVKLTFQQREEKPAGSPPLGSSGPDLSAPKTSHLKGERTELHVLVSGLDGVNAPIPVGIDNKPVATPGSYRIAPIPLPHGPIIITGPFNGGLSKTVVKIGDKVVTPIAESPRVFVGQLPAVTPGANGLSIQDGPSLSKLHLEISTGTASGSIPSGSETPGLSHVDFALPSGIVRLYLPEDARPGDTISGTFVTEPAGNTPAERDKNRETLGGLFIHGLQFDPTGAPMPLSLATGSSFTTILPAIAPLAGSALDPNNGSVGLTDKDGNKVSGGISLWGWSGSNSTGGHFTAVQSGSGDSSAAGQSPSQPIDSIAVHGLLNRNITGTTFPVGRPLVITGPFDGDLSNTIVKIGGSAVTPIAESPRKFVGLLPVVTPGPTRITVQEGVRETNWYVKIIDADNPVAQTTPPVLNAPATPEPPPPPKFTWLPSQPAPSPPVKYHLKIVEILPHQTPTEAMQAKVDKGVDDLWSAVQLTGTQAKVL